MLRLGVLVLTVGLLVGCGGDDSDESTVATDDTGAEEQTDEAAVAALERNIDELTAGQFGRAYEDVHPAQQELFDEETYTRCVSEGVEGVEVTDFEVEEIFQEDTPIPGTALTERATAITATITLRRGAGEQDDTTTYHEFYVDGRWVFSVSSGAALAEGNCS